MDKKFYRTIFEGAFDNALIETIMICGSDDADITWGIKFGRRDMFLRMLWMAYDMGIITLYEETWLRRAVKAILEVF